jgi:hypothetical protein
VQKDLSEFTTTVKNDGEKIFHKIKTQPVGDFDTNRSSNNVMANSVVASSSSDRLQVNIFRKIQFRIRDLEISFTYLDRKSRMFGKYVDTNS